MQQGYKNNFFNSFNYKLGVSDLFIRIVGFAFILVKEQWLISAINDIKSNGYLDHLELDNLNEWMDMQVIHFNKTAPTTCHILFTLVPSDTENKKGVAWELSYVDKTTVSPAIPNSILLVQITYDGKNKLQSLKDVVDYIPEIFDTIKNVLHQEKSETT